MDSINECKTVNYDHLICPFVPVLSNINNPSCETKLLTEVTVSLPETCNSKLLYGSINLWQKLHDGKWIYVQSKPNKLTVKCKNGINDYTLSGTGIISLNNDCV